MKNAHPFAVLSFAYFGDAVTDRVARQITVTPPVILATRPTLWVVGTALLDLL